MKFMLWGRFCRKDFWAWTWEVDSSLGMMSVKKKLCRKTSFFANSVNGMRCPIPGEGKMAMCGCFGCEASMAESYICSLQKTGVHYNFDLGLYIGRGEKHSSVH